MRQLIDRLSNMVGMRKSDGVERRTWKDGQLMWEYTTKDGKHHGLYRSWHSNGVRHKEGRYENGIQEGEWRVWDKHGRIEWEENYLNGRRYFWRRYDYLVEGEVTVVEYDSLGNETHRHTAFAGEANQ